MISRPYMLASTGMVLEALIGVDEKETNPQE
jgi:hypothetical protein